MSEASGQWMSVAEAGHVSGVSERTIWRWVRDGIVESRHEKHGQQSTRLVNRESLPEAGRQGVSEAVRAPVSVVDGGCPDMAAVGSGSQGLNGPRHELSPGATGRGVLSEFDRNLDSLAADLRARAGLAEQERDLLKDEMAHVIAEVEFLRQQLEIRAEELRRRDAMMGGLEQTNAQLAAALVQKALPPSSITETPRRTRWWHIWRRG